MDFEPFGDGGGYPKGFLRWAYESLGVTLADEVLHICSGSMRRGVCLDVRLGRSPTVVGDASNLPFRDESFRWAMADPPYSKEYARNLYGTESRYPRPGRIVREAMRVLRPGGRLGVLHFQVPMLVKPMRLVGVWGVTTGAGYAIRAWSVFEKPDRGLF
jgi:SAM-dependent methyltransferase